MNVYHQHNQLIRKKNVLSVQKNVVKKHHQCVKMIVYQMIIQIILFKLEINLNGLLMKYENEYLFN
jgi:hypothetical protein